MSEELGAYLTNGSLVRPCATCEKRFEVPRWREREAVAWEAVTCDDCDEREREAAVTKRRKLEREHRLSWVADNVERLMTDCGVLREHQHAKLEDFSAEIQETVRALFGDVERHRGLLVTGEPGTGKTYLLAAIARAVILRDSGQVRFIMARELLRRLWSTFRDQARESEVAVIEELTTVPVLLVDDVGHEGRISEAAVGAFHEIISRRNGNFLPTIISSNLALDEIGHAYDESIKSRLGAWLPIVTGGPDRRLG